MTKPSIKDVQHVIDGIALLGEKDHALAVGGIDGAVVLDRCAPRWVDNQHGIAGVAEAEQDAVGRPLIRDARNLDCGS